MQFQDRLAEEAFAEVAALLATAYQRHIAIRRSCRRNRQRVRHRMDLAKSDRLRALMDSRLTDAET